MIRALVLLVMSLAVISAARADNYCRTRDPVTNTTYCASEATVLKAIGKLSALTFSTLPSCSSGNQGQTVFITDSNVSTFNATITAGGGSNKGLAVCNGTNWTFH